MSSQNIINLKSFPVIKLISALLIIFGSIIAYILASTPDMMLMQIGGVQWNLVLCIPPFLSGIVLLFYAFITYYSVEITDLGDEINVTSRRHGITFGKDEIQAVRVRDAGRFFVGFVFMFITFYFVYYGIECGIYWFANHYAGTFEYILIPLLMIWIGGLILFIFPRKLLIILLKDKAILQKINYLPKDNTFQRLIDEKMGFTSSENVSFTRSTKYQYRLILGIIYIFLYIITSILVEIDGIVQPLHDLGIFIPIFILLFGVLMISSGLSTGNGQSVALKENTMKIEEKTFISKISGNNYNWIYSEEKIDRNKVFKKGFRKLTKFDYMLLFVLFGQASFLGFKFIAPVYLPYFDIFDLLAGVLMLVVLVFYQFEIVSTVTININSELKIPREILIAEALTLGSDSEERGVKSSIKERFSNYFKDFKGLLRTDFKIHMLKIGITYLASILVLTLSFFMLGFVLFIFI